MVSVLFLALASFFQQPIPELDALATGKDIEGLKQHAAPDLLASRPNAFRFLSGGSYAVGQFPWHVYALKDVATGDQYAVFSTHITCEDLGEQIFRWDGAKLTGFLPEDDSLGFAIVRHDIKASFQVDQKKGRFEDRLVLKRMSGTRPSFILRLSDEYRVSAISDEQGNPVPFAQAGGVVSVVATMGKALFTYKVSYGGVIDLPNFAGSISSSEIMLTDDYWYATIGRSAAPYSVTAAVPKGWKAIGQGSMVSDKEEGETRTVAFDMPLPVVYYSFSAGPFREVDDTIRDHRYSAWSMKHPDREMHVQNLLQADVIDFYSKTFSPYPFKWWGTVISKPYGQGAMEAYSHATYGEGRFPSEDAHEPSHTWWGGIIPNSYLHSMWNESFADFSQEFFQRERGLGNHEDRLKAFVARMTPDSSFKAGAVAEGTPDLGPTAGSLGYGKGALVLEMLEDETGTAALLDCIHGWLSEHQKGNLGEWAGFEKAVNHITGKSYGWFFDQWLGRPGWPVFSIDNVRWTGGKVVGTVKFESEPYRLPVEVLAQFSDGKSELKKAVIGGSGEVSVAFSRKPASVSFDPWLRLLRNIDDTEQPLQLRRFLGRCKRYRDPAHPAWLDTIRGDTISVLPKDLDGVLIIGSPESVPIMKDLCWRVGFKVEGNKLSYKDTTIDLDHGAALAIVDLGAGKRCAIGLGTTEAELVYGRSRLAVMDGYGRFLRGVTDPKTTGPLTYRL